MENSMQEPGKNVVHEESLTSGAYNKFAIAFFGLVFIVFMFGSAPIFARLALLGMVGMGIGFLNSRKIPRKAFLIIEVLLWGVFLGVGLISGFGPVILMGILMPLIVAIALIVLKVERRLGIRL